MRGKLVEILEKMRCGKEKNVRKNGEMRKGAGWDQGKMVFSRENLSFQEKERGKENMKG